MSNDCTCLFGHDPGEICENTYIEPEECSHWKATRSVPCKECGGAMINSDQWYEKKI
ncbi:23112_t:CDS:2 [Entrophospora sp. SA101]|nr:23112_t:CDS:2 [Entrophospora sp. SA101]